MSSNNNPTRKHLLTPDQQVEYLKRKGVVFSICTEEKAIDFLSEHNNYFKICAYKKNFTKHKSGIYTGNYIDLDFGMLIDLSKIDMELRYIFIHMLADIEHFTKVKLLDRLLQYQKDFDSFDIVQEFRYTCFGDDRFRKEIDGKNNNIYCKGIIEKYRYDLPIWAFIEIISFGVFIRFYNFCADKLQILDYKNDYYILTSIKDLRNACAHNNCILFNIVAKNIVSNSKHEIMQELSKLGFSKTTRKNKMHNETIKQIVTTLFFHRKIVTSNPIIKRSKNELYNLSERILLHIDYYKTNDDLKSSLYFLVNVIQRFFPKETVDRIPQDG